MAWMTYFFVLFGDERIMLGGLRIDISIPAENLHPVQIDQAVRQHPAAQSVFLRLQALFEYFGWKGIQLRQRACQALFDPIQAVMHPD